MFAYKSCMCAKCKRNGTSIPSLIHNTAVCSVESLIHNSAVCSIESLIHNSAVLSVEMLTLQVSSFCKGE